jgi:hypothetical protein
MKFLAIPHWVQVAIGPNAGSGQQPPSSMKTRTTTISKAKQAEVEAAKYRSMVNTRYMKQSHHTLTSLTLNNINIQGVRLELNQHP